MASKFQVRERVGKIVHRLIEAGSKLEMCEIGRQIRNILGLNKIRLKERESERVRRKKKENRERRRDW